MPAILDQCVESLLGKWKEKPSSRPKHKEGQKAQAQAFALCTASLKKAGKLEHDDETFYLTEDVEFELPVMTAWALTNKPHIMGLDELSFVNAEGEPWVEGSEGEKHLKVPLLVMGKWKHRMGILNFTKGLADKIEKNFHEGLAGHKISADAKHRDVLGAVAWATGKFFFEVNKRGLKQWGLIAKPTPQGEQLVTDRTYRYASIEVHPNFENRMVSAALSADDIEGEWNVACPTLDFEAEEDEMPDALDLEQIQTQMQGVQAQLDTAQAQLEQRDGRIAQLEQFAITQFVDGIVLQAEHYRDGEDRSHSVAFLKWLKVVLKCEKIGEEGDTVITLEGDDAGAVHSYYRRAIDHLARTQPGTGPIMTSSDTEGDKAKAIDDNGKKPVILSEDEDAEIDDMWGKVPVKVPAEAGGQ